MATINISLPDNMREFVEAEVAQGGYNTTSEYFRALVRDEQERKTKAQLEALLLEGLRSGEPAPITAEDWAEIRNQIRERAARRKLEELRKDVAHGFEQIEHGEYTDYAAGMEVANKIIAAGRQRIAAQKRATG